MVSSTLEQLRPLFGRYTCLYLRLFIRYYLLLLHIPCRLDAPLSKDSVLTLPSAR